MTMTMLVKNGLLFFVLGCLSAGTHAGTITYYHNDLAGTPVVATNEQGQVTWRESYRPYGERLTNSAAAVGNKIWFASRRQDAETGLIYMGARFYDPVAGRFVSTDPVLLDEKSVHSFNRYSYANNNPYRYVDPDGRMGRELAITGAGVLLIGGTVYALSGTEQRARMEQTLSQIGTGVREWMSDVGLTGTPANGSDGLIFAKPPKDARDPQGAKAPGKPGESEGFKDPKSGEDWVPNPNGRGNGWLGDDGKVWVPTGPGGEAHGGAHWDVQNPKGGYENIYPGGTKR